MVFLRWRRHRSADVVELLGRVPAFSTLEHADLEHRPGRGAARVRPAQAVFREGDASDTCYVVREGRARAIRTTATGAR